MVGIEFGDGASFFLFYLDITFLNVDNVSLFFREFGVLTIYYSRLGKLN